MYNKDKNYTPVENVATIGTSPDDKTTPTVELGQYKDILIKMKKYFGTQDAYSIYVPAAEQECGSGKPSTKANKNVTE